MQGRSRRAKWLGCVLGLALGVAHAGPREGAKAKRDSAEKLLGAGDYEGALKSYEEASAIVDDPAFLLARASLLVRLRRYTDAKTIYETYLARNPDKKRRAEVTKVLGELEKVLRTTLLCETDPPGATVYLGSRVETPLGVTPFQSNLPPGTHRLIIEREGYETREERLDIEDGATQPLRYTLNPEPMQLDVSSQPSGAEVWVGGASKGKTPLRLSLPPGEAVVEVFADGFTRERRDIRGASGETLALSVALQESAVEVRVEVTPPLAALSLVGRAEVAKEGVFQLAPGDYEVQAQKKGFRAASVRFSVARGKPQTLKLALEPFGEEIPLRANVPEARVSVDGAALGSVAALGSLELAWGKHEILVEAPNRSPYRGALEVKPGAPFSADVSLKRAPRKSTWAFLGAGVLGLGLGVAQDARVFALRAKLDDGDGARDEALDKLGRICPNIVNDEGVFCGRVMLPYIVGGAFSALWFLRHRDEGKSKATIRTQGGADENP